MQTTNVPNPDYSIAIQRTLIGITPISEACLNWIDENVHSEGWQWLGPTLWVDHRCAPTLIEALSDQGFCGEGR